MDNTPPPALSLDLREYAQRTTETAIYPFAGLGSVQGLMYVGLGLAGEAGEVANQIKKIARDDGALISSERKAKIFDELGDVMWYWLRVCRELDLDPYDVLKANVSKLTVRATNGTLNGDGQHRGARVRQAALEWEAEMAEASGKEDVFAVPLEGYERLLVVQSLPGGGTQMTCRSLRCTHWRPVTAPFIPVDSIQRSGMAHIMAEHTPWGRAGRD